MRKFFHGASAESLFLIGLLTLPAFVFQEKLLYRALDGALFLGLAILSGKKIRPLPALILLVSITGAALFVPFGHVLARPFGLPITEGALTMGFSRAILLLGLFYLSKFTVTKGLVLPGKTGNGLAKVFFYFERFSDHYSMVSVRNLPESLDRLLLKISEPGTDSNTEQTCNKRNTMPLIIPVSVSLTCWGFLLL